ncbi:hypothetical protein [Candidatus Palauibacter sp.]|uniref:hypothetical protein n=1 Tax=Candidatus Palauibacter sp. TaxID=3101350 RepID=UPI003AF2740F
MNDAPMKLTTSQVSLILQRAAEIDARGDTLSIDELERIAAEAGIDARATRTAIAEFVAEEMPVPSPAPESGPPAVPAVRVAKSHSPSPVRIAVGGAVGVAGGFLMTHAETGAALGLGGTVIYLMLRAVQSMRRGRQLDFQLQNFAVWFGATMGGLATDLFRPEEFIGPLFIVWILTSIIGALLVQFGPRDEDPEDGAPIDAVGR